jgi:hypothetical protein
MNSFNDNEEKKQQLIQRYLANRKAILANAKALPAEAHNLAFVGEWTIKELLAHLCGWDSTFFEAFQEILQEQLPGFFLQYDHNWQSYNNRMIRKYRLDDVNAMIRRVQKSQERLAALLQSFTANDIFRDCGVCTEKGFKITVASLLESVIQEEQEHLHQIQEFSGHLEQQVLE